FETDPSHAAFPGRWLERAARSNGVEVREGAALEILPAPGGDLCDLVFLDADTEPLTRYLDGSGRLLRPGGMVVADNALWGGRVLDESVDDAGTRGVREFNRKLASDPRLTSIVVPLGDGVAIGLVNP